MARDIPNISELEDSSERLRREWKMRPKTTISRKREDRRKQKPPRDAVELTQRLLSGYRKQEPPLKTFPTEVRLGIYVVSFYAISEGTMDYSVSMYLRQSWKDPRLAFDPIDGKIDTIRLHDDSWNRIWMPDVFFRNEKRASYHAITVPNRLLKLNSTGFLW